MYLGFHNTDDPDDTYSSSSTSPQFRIDWTRGHLERTILAEGTTTEMISLEHYMLKHFDAKNNTKFYNKSSGGGKGIDPNYVPPKRLFGKICAWANGTLKPTPKKKVEGIFNKLKIDKLVQSIKNGEREVIQVSVQQVYTIPRNQVRMNKIHHKHVEELVLSFSNPSKALNQLTPIIIVVDENGKMIRVIDGNHRIEAAYIAKWVEIPAIILTQADFDYNLHNEEYFGIKMNHEPWKVLGNTDDDLTKQLLGLSDRYPHLDVDSQEFISMAKSAYSEYWHPSKITKRCNKLKETKEEEKMKRGMNFITYTTHQIDKLKKQLQKTNKKTAIIAQSCDSICNAGIGGALNSMTSSGFNNSIILVHFPKYSTFIEREKHIMQFNSIVNLLKDSVKVSLVYLNPFEENKIASNI
jgi:hypothetical protein